MKAKLTFLICGLCAATAVAGFENWTSKDGRKAELELVNKRLAKLKKAQKASSSSSSAPPRHPGCTNPSS